MKRTYHMISVNYLGKLTMTCIVFLSLIIRANAQIDKTRVDNTKFIYEKPLFDFDYNKPVFKLNDEQSNNTNKFLRFTVLTGYREGVKPSKGMVNFNVVNDDKAETSRYFMYDLSIQDMLTNSAKPEHVILRVKDPSKYRYDPKSGSEQEWLRKNGYCYECTLPSAVYTMKTMDMIREDCASQFKVKVTFEGRSDTEIIYTITEVQ